MGAGSRRGSRKTLSVIAAVACAAALCTAGVIYGASQGGNSSAALEQLAGSGVHKGSILNVEVPMQQLAGVQPGDIVKGKNGDLSWTGAVTKDSTLSPTQGCVTVRVISDKYIAPGTPVSGNVGGAAFMGTVVGSPNHQERIGSIERRIAALEPSAKGSVNALQRKLDRLKRTLRRMEGHKTIEERVEELSKRVIDLERRPPSKDTATFSGNIAGFHFVGSLGKRPGMADRLDKIDARLGSIMTRPTPEVAMMPMERKLKDLEKRINDLEGDGGKWWYHQQMTALEKQLASLETQYGNGGGGENSKWYGTEDYHGLVPKVKRRDPWEQPAGKFDGAGN